jgi:chitin disaccharide deacetylase
MVGEPAAADAVERARRLPQLRVGLHLVLVSGRPVLPPDEIPALVGSDGRFGDDLLRAGVRFFFDLAARAQLAREIRAQFSAFRATGLALDHANAHRHMHLHPTIGRLLIEIGREYDLRAVRVPHEPLSVLRRAGGGPGDLAVAAGHAPFAALLRRRARAAGLVANDRLLGLAWTGAMSEDRVLRLVDALPPGTSELYLHPSAGSAELAALLSPAVRRRIAAEGIALGSYDALA